MKLLNFWANFRKNIQISNFMRIRPLAAELFHANGQTDIHVEANIRVS